MGTQWHTIAGPAGLLYQGLRYEVLDTVQRRLPPIPQAPDAPDDATLFWQLQTLERHALEHLNQQS